MVVMTAAWVAASVILYVSNEALMGSTASWAVLHSRGYSAPAQLLEVGAMVRRDSSVRPLLRASKFAVGKVRLVGRSAGARKRTVVNMVRMDCDEKLVIVNDGNTASTWYCEVLTMKVRSREIKSHRNLKCFKESRSVVGNSE